MIEEIKILLADAADNYTDEQIALALKMAMAEVEGYCNRELDMELELVAERIAVIKLSRMGTDGVASLAFSGVSENYIDGYPAEVKAFLDRKRKIKVL